MNDLSKGFNIGCGILAALVGVPVMLCVGLVFVGQVSENMARDKAAAEAAKAVKASPAPKADQHTPAKQQARATMMATMTAKGGFNKIEDRGGGLVRVWTGPLFDGLDFQTKQSLVGVIYAYHFDGTRDSDAVILHDGRSGKRIGEMTKAGLTMQ